MLISRLKKGHNHTPDSYTQLSKLTALDFSMITSPTTMDSSIMSRELDSSNEILTIIKTPESYIQLSKLATQVSNIIERVGLLHNDVAHYYGLFHDFKRFGLF